MSDKEGLARKSSVVETSQLIELVRQQACLWDRRDPCYRNRQEKYRAWEEINRAIDPTYDQMTRSDQREFGMILNRKWYNIRDCYKKYLNGTARNISGRPYHYANQLTFLDAMYDNVPSRRNKRRSTARDKESEENDTEEPEQEWLNEVFVDIDPADELPVPPKKIKTEFPPTKGSEPDENIIFVLANLIQKEEDEDRAFFKSITPAVKSLSSDDKISFRIQVMKLLRSFKMKDKKPPMLHRTKVRDSDSD